MIKLLRPDCSAVDATATSMASNRFVMFMVSLPGSYMTLYDPSVLKTLNENI